MIIITSQRSLMPISRAIAFLVIIIAGLLRVGQVAHADLLIQIDKFTQRMIVIVDDEELYNWPVSTGRSGYDTPSGVFKPFRMEIDHHSEEWDNAPMPYSIFFTQTGNAIHGTYEVRHLGHPVSHGCVRLSVKNAAVLWKLLKQQKMANTTVVLTGVIPGQEASALTRSKPIPLNADDPRYADDPPYGARPARYPPRYDDSEPPLPLPFFLFRR